MSTGSTQPFRPAGTASAAATNSVSSIALVGGGNAVLIYNSAASTVNDTPVPAGGRMLVGGGPFVNHAAVLLSSGSGTVYFTLGDGDTY